MPKSRAATRSVSVSDMLVLFYYIDQSVQVCRGSTSAKPRGGPNSCNVSIYCVCVGV